MRMWILGVVLPLLAQGGARKKVLVSKQPVAPPMKGLPMPQISKGPILPAPPMIEQQLVVGKEAPPEPVLFPPPPHPDPIIPFHHRPSPYVPPTLIDLPPPQKYPNVIHASPSKLPGVPSILPLKGAMGQHWRPVAILAGPSAQPFRPVGPAPVSKQGPVMAFRAPNVRPTRKGEI